ncbi:MAG: LacI family transcriptional regulator [Chloroflexi bacterium HGW-Chloroflexi-10]|nr:MAG: LacI family transcriptional regulator [Chloroflexi bacterium HGW-Chloroflexi-10]
MPNRVTIKDVASMAGVSYQTVSKVLNGTVSVTPETAQRIAEAAQALGYKPNQSARSLRSQRTQMIGYSWRPAPTDETNPILDQFLHGMICAAEKLDYYLLFFPFDAPDDPVQHYRVLIDTGRIDGFIISGVEYDDPRVSYLQERKIPFVGFGRSREGIRFPWVDVDGGMGMLIAAQHLIAQGHKKIAALAWDKNSRVGNDRLSGYFQAMQDAGLPILEEWIVRDEGVYELGYENTLKLMALPESKRPTAIMALNDQMAVGAMFAIQSLGIKVGQQVAVTGFDGAPFARYTNPPLTTLQQPASNIGKTVIEMLIQLCNGQKLENSTILMKPELIVRQSSLKMSE